jgi:hypothetical protein
MATGVVAYPGDYAAGSALDAQATVTVQSPTSARVTLAYLQLDLG